MKDIKHTITPLVPGARFDVPYPFYRTTYHVVEEDGGCDVPSWCPGTRYYLADIRKEDHIADGEGMQILKVVSTHKPGVYAERVFYTRQWKAPDGQLFGKGTLRMCSLRKFMRLTQGYRYPYRLAATLNNEMRCLLCRPT